MLAASDLVVVKSGTKMKRSNLDPITPALDTSDLTRDQVTLDKNGRVELSAPAINQLYDERPWRDEHVHGGEGTIAFAALQPAKRNVSPPCN